MSSDTIVAKRYAKALFEAAQSRNLVSPVEEELKLIVNALAENEALELLLQHPKLDFEAKKNMLTAVFQAAVSDIVLNTMLLLVERGRGSLFPALYDYYVSISNEALGQADALVYSPVPLSEQEKLSVSAQFGKLIGKTVRVENQVDPNLLGGIQVKIGDRLYDGSLSGKLSRMETRLKQNQAI